jgi:hypothetical protein
MIFAPIKALMSTIGRQKPTFSSSNLSQISPILGTDRVKDFKLRLQAKTPAPFQEVSERKLRSRQLPVENGNESESKGVFPNIPNYFPWQKREGAIASSASQVATQVTPNSTCHVASNVDRVLIGQNELGGEARIRIASGLIAGTEVQIIAGKYGVEASLLSTPEHARLNVEHVMEELAYRLRRKGYAVQVKEHTLGRQNKPEQEDNEPDDQSFNPR